MSTDLEKSFTANLKYNLKSDRSQGLDLVSTDFSYIKTTTSGQTTVTGKGATVSTQNVDDVYLCVNTKASDAVTLYFRYETISANKAGYRIWVRGKGDESDQRNQTGKLLSSSNPGTLFANINYGRPHFFRLVQRNADNTEWVPVTILEYDLRKSLLLQVETSKDSYSNIGPGSRKTPSDDPSLWYAYLDTGRQDEHWYLDNVKTGEDYVSSDQWGPREA